MNLEIIKKLSENKNGGLKKIANEIGMSEQNLHRCIRNNKIQASDLEKIAEVLGVNIDVFFDKKMSINSISIANGDSAVSANGNVHIENADSKLMEERIKYLEQILQEKERLIKILMERK